MMFKVTDTAMKFLLALIAALLLSIAELLLSIAELFFIVGADLFFQHFLSTW